MMIFDEDYSVTLVRVFFNSHWLVPNDRERESTENGCHETFEQVQSRRERVRVDKKAWQFQAEREREFELQSTLVPGLRYKDAVECGKTKSKVITLVKHKRSRQGSELIITGSIKIHLYGARREFTSKRMWNWCSEILKPTTMCT